MRESGWKLLPAAFFLLLNFFAAPAKHLFWLRLGYVLFLVCLFFFLRSVDLKRVLPFLAAGLSVILFAYGILQRYLLFPMYLRQFAATDSFYVRAMRIRIESGRVFSIFSLPTFHAFVCGLLLLFIFHYLLRQHGWLKMFWALLFLAGLFNLLLTQSFGGILALAAGLLFYLFYSRTLSARFLAPLVMFLALIFFIVVAMRFSEARQLEPVKLRLNNWTQAVRVMADSPLWGVGLGNYEIAVPPYIKPGEASSIYAHNFFLQLLAETGVPLFLLLLVLIGTLAGKHLTRLVNRSHVLFLSALLLIFLHNLIDVGGYFFFAGIALAVCLAQLLLVADANARRQRLWLLPLLVISIPLILGMVADDWQRNGDFLASRGETDLARVNYQKSLRLVSGNYRSLMGLAMLAEREGQTVRAQEYLIKVLRVHPHFSYAAYLYSQLRYRDGDLWPALFYAQQAARSNRKNADYQRWHDSLKSLCQNKPIQPGN